MKINSSIVLVIVALLAISCSSSKKVVVSQPEVQTINLALATNPQADKYVNLEYGIRLNVQDNRADKRLIQVYDASAVSKPIVNVNPEVTSFIPEGIYYFHYFGPQTRSTENKQKDKTSNKLMKQADR